jgi:flavin prenyltransferase
MNRGKKVIVAVTGASGAIYARQILDKLLNLGDQVEEVALIVSSNGKKVWEYELDNADYIQYPVNKFENDDFFSPCASGSSNYSAMVVIPCSMGTLGRISNGISDNLICRSADVMLKERRTLIVVPRESPLSLVHLRNMKLFAQAGGIICPANPSFYFKPGSIEELISTFTDRVLQLAGFNLQTQKWQEKCNKE